MEGKENSKVFTLQILGKEKDSWISLGKRILDNLTQIESLDCMHAKHRKSLEFARFSTAEKSDPPPEMEIGNEVPAMLERWSPGSIPGLHRDDRYKSLCSMRRRSSETWN